MRLLAGYQNQVLGGRVHFFEIYTRKVPKHASPSGMSASPGHLPATPHSSHFPQNRSSSRVHQDASFIYFAQKESKYFSMKFSDQLNTVSL